MAGFFITATYGEHSVSHYFFALARTLAARGHQVTVLVGGQRRDVEEPAGNPAILTWPSVRPTGWCDARFLWTQLKQRRPDCIIGNFGAVNLSLLVGWWAGVPCRLAWYHTLRRQIAADAQVPAWRQQLQIWRKRWVYRFATQLIANSAASAADVQQVYGVSARKCAVLTFVIPDPQVPATERRAEQIVCVGRLHPSKGQATLLRALPEVLAAVPQARLTLIGDGPERAAYEALVQQLGVAEQCIFTGVLPLPEVLRAMAAAAVCVSTSHSEAFGLVNVEAQAVGTPVVASAVDGIAEIVLDGETGYLVPPGDAHALAQRLITLLNNPHLQQQFSQRARQHFEEKFSQRHLARHAQWLEELVAA